MGLLAVRFIDPQCHASRLDEVFIRITVHCLELSREQDILVQGECKFRVIYPPLEPGKYNGYLKDIWSLVDIDQRLSLIVTGYCLSSLDNIY